MKNLFKLSKIYVPAKNHGSLSLKNLLHWQKLPDKSFLQQNLNDCRGAVAYEDMKHGFTKF